MKGFGEKHKNTKKKKINSHEQTIKDQIIRKAFKQHSQGNIQEAKKYYENFINKGFLDHRVFSNYGMILLNLGELKKAEIFTHKAIELNPNYAMAYSNLGGILKDLGKLQEAELSTRKAIKLDPNYAMAYSNLGGILKDLGKLQEAELSQRKAIELKPNFAEAHYSMGNILRDLGKLKKAELSQRKAIKLKPNFAEAHYSIGNILRDLGKLQEAELSQRKAIELKPNFAKANEALGLVLLEKNEYDLSLIYFSESAKLLNDQIEKNSNNQRFKVISKAKIEHDIEQFEYLASKNYGNKKFSDLALLYKKVASEINWPSDTSLITLNDKYQSLLKDSYNRLVHILEAPKLKEVINNSLNVEQITNDYLNDEFGLTYIDNFLSSKAIKSLRDFLLESTIWFNVKQNGYVGTFLREGFANPLIIQIANELKTKFPKIFKNYPINHIWAFKYDSRAKNKKSSLKGINVHADFAAINVNFWITPKKANLNPKSGGLIVYDVEAPKEWNFNTFNNDEQRIRKELKKSKGNTKVIPYNENRAVIFNSNLFHETDSYEFKEGYENRRINVTLLFGRRKVN